ncbi:PAS domain-containing protein [Methylorubrum extorquens]
MDTVSSAFAGGGLMGARMRAHDWSDTSLGPQEQWPPALLTLVRVMLNSRQPMFICWGEDRTLVYNDTYAPMLGVRHPAALGRPFFETWPEVQGEVGALMDRVFAGDPVHMDDLQLTLHRNGYPEETHFAFSYTPVPGDDGKIIGLFCACTETTNRVTDERRQVAEANRERDRLFEMSRDLFGVATFDGYLTSINPSWSRHLGRSNDELLARPFADIIHPDDLGVTGDVVAALRSGRAVHQFHVRLLTANGMPISFAWSAVPEADAASGIFYTVGRDITAEKHAAETLAQTEEALRQSQKMEAVGQLTGGVAHDFNNLLTVIKSSTDLLKRPGLPEERRQRYIGAISDTVARAAKLTGQLLAFARRQALKPEVFDVGRSVATISDMVSTLTGSRIKIVTHIPDEPCFINADPSQFDTSLVNMAVNARDAMDGEGTLTITVHPVSTIPPIRSHPAVQGDFVAVCIEDTGSGIAPEQIEHIFEPFFTTKGVGQGTGLGLSQVFGFAKQSGGEVRVQSTLGKGTMFVLYLPRVEADVRPALAEPEPLVDGHGLCVLVVEDNVDVGTFATQTLAELGYVTVWANNAEEALAELARDADRFDVVFSDVVMPGMNGIDLAHRIRRDHHDLPVLLASGYSHVLAQNGTYGFELLHKPYSVEQLSRLLRKVASWQRRRRMIGK